MKGNRPIVLVDCIDWEITLREVVFSVLIAGVMVFLGFVFASAIEKRVDDATLKYRQATSIQNPEEFRHAMDTNVGHAFVRGKLVAKTPVSTSKVPGEHLRIFIKHQEWRRHTRTVHYTVYDSKGRPHTKTRTETYHSWDTISTSETNSAKVVFCGTEFPYGKFDYSCATTTVTIVGGGFLNNRRDVIYTTSDGFTATIFADLRNKGFSGKADLVSQNIETYRKSLTTSHAVAFFWVFWILFVCMVLFAFYYAENNWLEDNSRKG